MAAAFFSVCLAAGELLAAGLVRLLLFSFFYTYGFTIWAEPATHCGIQTAGAQAGDPMPAELWLQLTLDSHGPGA